jgi:hypothetical protein
MRPEVTEVVFNERVREAATWLVVADLVRRHDARLHLGVREMHPCGGMYDCIDVLANQAADHETLVSFHRASGNAHFFASLNGKARGDAAGEGEINRMAYVSCRRLRPASGSPCRAEARRRRAVRSAFASWPESRPARSSTARAFAGSRATSRTHTRPAPSYVKKFAEYGSLRSAWTRRSARRRDAQERRHGLGCG